MLKVNSKYRIDFFIFISLKKQKKLMKLKINFLFILIPIATYSQNTEVFLLDINTKNNAIELTNKRNISNNEGYDNQPSFYNDNIILFASTRNNQTDIAKYNVRDKTVRYLNNTPNGSEYSPLKIPNQKAVSAIRLDTDGKQFLYRYDFETGENKILINNLIIGYHTWYNKETLVSSVLEDEFLSLYVTHLKNNNSYKFQQKIGRSLHKIPNSNLVSYISKDKDSVWEIKSVNPNTGETKFIVNTISKAEDMCWLINGTILMPKGNTIYKFNPKTDKNWTVLKSFNDKDLQNITRLITNEIGTQLCLVSEAANNDLKLDPKLENIKWIAGNWKGEAFGGQTEENWSEPFGDSMMATFKLVNNGTVSFYEIEIIRELENTLILQLKHFNSDLKGWETKDETIDFPLKEITSNKVIFEGMTFEKISYTEMNVYVDIHNEDGTINTVKFNYKK